jgi:hypothetical protein
VRKIFLLASLWLGLAGWTRGAETLTLNLTDGTSWTGEILKFDDNGMMLKATGDVYTNLPWARFSQATLKQLVQNPQLTQDPKRNIRQFVEVFIEPDESQLPPKPAIKVHPVTRLERPAHSSVLGGMVHSPAGLFILLVLYLANLFAAWEVAIFRARPVAQVVGLSALLPIIGPVVFLVRPTQIEPAAEMDDGTTAAEGKDGKMPGKKMAAEIQIAEVSPQEMEKDTKPKPQVFARGKFTFNKRFIETKFAGFVGELKGDGKLFVMSIRTTKETFTVNYITQIRASDFILETVEKGVVTVPLADLKEITLTPKPA